MAVAKQIYILIMAIINKRTSHDDNIIEIFFFKFFSLNSFMFPSYILYHNFQFVEHTFHERIYVHSKSVNYKGF